LRRPLCGKGRGGKDRKERGREGDEGGIEGRDGENKGPVILKQHVHVNQCATDQELAGAAASVSGTRYVARWQHFSA